MMALKQKIISQIYDDQSGEILNTKVIEDKVIKSPQSIDDLGYNHEEQIELLQKAQDAFLSSQTSIFKYPTSCPKCDAKLYRKGKIKSTFNSVFTDHTLHLTAFRCINSECKHVIELSLQGIFGDYRHPDLVEIQTKLASEHSFVKSQELLRLQNKRHRSVNGQVNLKRITEKVGACLAEIHQDKSLLSADSIENQSTLIVQADGGYIKDKHPNRSTFEAILTTVYSPTKIIQKVSKSGGLRSEITEKSFAASSFKDHHKSIKSMLLVSAIKEGLNKDTNVIAFADGAKNCWNVIKSLKAHCKSLECILDWYHIRVRFDKIIGQMKSEYSDKLESIKWKVWHGKSEDALERLTLMYGELIATDFADKVHQLLKYLANNRDYLVNYESRKAAGKPFTSSVIESAIETVVNTRFKKKQKAQWNRESAHRILQIRTSVASNQWESDWKQAKNILYKKVA